jgi:hypothetical protein
VKKVRVRFITLLASMAGFLLSAGAGFGAK